MKAGVDAAGGRREHFSFFRQSGWMMVATVVSGLLMSFAHNSAGRMPDDQYALFATMLDTLLLLLIPSAGVQAMFAQMTAMAVTEEQVRNLRAALVGVLGATAVFGVLAGLGLGVSEAWLARIWKADQGVIFWVTLGVSLVLLVYPVFTGVLQGRQDFLWMGNAAMLGGLGRLLGVTVAVGWLGHWALGAMVGVLVGAVVALMVPVWASRDLWQAPRGGDFDLRRWLGQLVPVMLGVGAGAVMLGFDTLFVRAVFGKEGMGYYAAAGRIGRAVVMFTMPMAQVLFPKVARSAATGEPTAVLRMALGATLGTGLLAAIACTVAPELPLRILYGGQHDFLKAAPLVPWFAWCMLPLAAAYTLVNHLIARGGFGWRRGLAVAAVAVAYVLLLLSLQGLFRTLPVFDGFRAVLLTIGIFSSLLLTVAAWLSRRPRAAGPAGPPA